MPRFTRSIAAAAAAGVTVAALRAAKTAKSVVKKSSAGAGASAAALASAAAAALSKASAPAPTLSSALPGVKTGLKLRLKLNLKPKSEPASGSLAAEDAVSGESAPIEPSAAASVPAAPVAAVKKSRAKGAAKVEPATEPSTTVPAAPVAKAAPRGSRAAAGSRAAKDTLTTPIDAATSATLDPPKRRPGRPAKSAVPATKASTTSSGPRSRPTRTAKPVAATAQDQPRQPDYSYLERWDAEVARAAAADRGEDVSEVTGQNAAARTKGAVTLADLLSARKAATAAKDAEPAQQRRLDPVTLGECEGVTTLEELGAGIREAFFRFVHANPLPFTAGDLTRQAGMLKPVVLDLAEQLSKTDPRLFGLPAGSLFASNVRIQKFEDYDVVKVWDAHRQVWREWSKVVEELEGLAAVRSSARSSAPTTSSSREVGKKREREEDAEEEEEEKVSKKAKTAGETLAEPVVEGRKRGASEADVDIEEEKVVKRVRFRL